MTQEAEETTAENTDLTSELETLRSELTEAKERLQSFGDWTPEKIKEVTKRKIPKEINVDELRSELEAEISERFSTSLAQKEAALAEKVSLLGTIEGELKNLRLDSSVLLKAGEHVKPDAMDLLRPIVQKDADFKDGKVIFKDEKGNPRYSKVNPKQFLSPDEYLLEVTTKYPSLAVDKSKTGTGALRNTTTSTDAGGISLEKYKAMSLEQRRALPGDVRAQLAEQNLGINNRSKVFSRVK